MDKEQLLKRIEEGESEEVELKESCSSNSKISETICAFANTDGGYIIFGVTKNREIKGLVCDFDKFQQDISNAKQNIRSSPTISSDIHTINGKKILVVEVQRATDKNAHTFQGCVWVRVTSINVKLEGQSLIDFLKNRQLLCFDEQDSDSTLDDLEIKKVQSYLSKRGQQDYLKSKSLTDFLVSNMLAKSNGKMKIKNSAILFFAKEPFRWFSQNEIRVVRFGGTDAVNVIAQRDFKQDVIENIEQTIEFIRENLSKRFVIPEDSPRRIEIEEYPMQVIREAIVNAVAHRDYFSYDSIQVNIFPDRIEISNPGSLPRGLVKEYFGKRSVRRNPITYRLLRDCNYVEGLGTGIPRMINEMRKAGLKDPEFNFEGDFFIVYLRNAKGNIRPIEKFKDLNDRQINGIVYLQQNRTIKSKTYANINSVSLPSALKDLAEMIRFGYLKKVGSFRGAYYVLDEKTAEKLKVKQ